MANQELLANIEDVIFDGINVITFKTSDNGDLIFKYPDDAADVMVIIVNRMLKDKK